MGRSVSDLFLNGFMLAFIPVFCTAVTAFLTAPQRRGVVFTLFFLAMCLFTSAIFSHFNFDIIPQKFTFTDPTVPNIAAAKYANEVIQVPGVNFKWSLESTQPLNESSKRQKSNQIYKPTKFLESEIDDTQITTTLSAQRANPAEYRRRNEIDQGYSINEHGVPRF